MYNLKFINKAYNGEIEAVKKSLATEKCTSNEINEALQVAAKGGHTGDW